MLVKEKLDLSAIKAGYTNTITKVKKRITICAGTACVANGALTIFEAFRDAAERYDLDLAVELNYDDPCNKDIYLSGSGCQGFCQMGPLLTILPDNILYNGVKAEDVDEIIEQTIINHKIIDRLLYTNPRDGRKCRSTDEIDFYKKQHRFIIKDCGVINPGDITEYIALDGYKSLKQACLEMTRQDVCELVINAGLRGRGGGGFPTGRKWDLARIQNNRKKYVICNGDEGDPGAFMDRSLMEGNPHSVIEGMAIAAMAIGADEGYVYVRAEYPLAVQRMKKAVIDATEAGLLGENIFDSGFNFTLHVMEGAGAFVCGEETALMSSIEGKRGMPSPKPPYPSIKGLWGKPTIINNVETFATVPVIITMGAEAYRKIGTEGSPGTKTFAITGHVANTGLIEVPFGTTLREIIEDIAGGVTGPDGSIGMEHFKAVQIGGPSGGCLTEEHLDLPLDFDSLKSQGAMVGSGGLVVVNKDTCMVNFASFFMQFTQNESCGKCVLCREGTKQLLVLLEDIMQGKGTEETIMHLEDLADAVTAGSLCGLGKTAPNPVFSTLRYFKDEYLTHINDKRCATGNCKDLMNYTIDPEKCIGCTACARKCPVNAISGDKKQAHTINNDVCTKCGVCKNICKFDAVIFN